MTTNTEKNLAPIRDVVGIVLAAMSNVAETVVARVRSMPPTQMQAQTRDTTPRPEPVSVADIAAERLQRLDTAVTHGDLSAADARELRSGYERIRARERAGLPPLDLTY